MLSAEEMRAQANDRVNKHRASMLKAGYKSTTIFIKQDILAEMKRLADIKSLTRHACLDKFYAAYQEAERAKQAPTEKNTIEIEIKPTEEITDTSTPEQDLASLGMDSDTSPPNFDENEIITEEDLPGLADFEDPEELNIEDADPAETYRLTLIEAYGWPGGWKDKAAKLNKMGFKTKGYGKGVPWTHDHLGQKSRAAFKASQK